MHARGCRTGAELGSLRVAWYTHGPPPDMPRAPYEVRGGRVGWITCNPGHQSRPAPTAEYFASTVQLAMLPCY